MVGVYHMPGLHTGWEALHNLHLNLHLKLRLATAAQIDSNLLDMQFVMWAWETLAVEISLVVLQRYLLHIHLDSSGYYMGHTCWLKGEVEKCLANDQQDQHTFMLPGLAAIVDVEVPCSY